MQLNKLAGEVTGAEQIRKPQATTPSAAGVGNVSDVGSRSDSVQLSDQGLALSGDDSVGETSASTLDPKQVDDIRAKILSGAYNSLEMAHNVARAILRSGDL